MCIQILTVSFLYKGKAFGKGAKIHMNEWQQAFLLTTYNIRSSIKELLLLFLIYIVIFIVIISSLHTYFNNGSFIFDLFFIGVFSGLATQWVKWDSLQRNESLSRFMLFLQLPFKHSTIIKSWFITNLLNTLPFITFLLTFLYAFSTDFKTMMPPFTYICFAIVLLSFSVITMEGIPTNKTKMVVNNITTKRLVILILSFLLFLGIFIFVTFFSNYGIMHWLIIIVQKSPSLLAIVSIVFATLVLWYRYKHIQKQIVKEDFL